VKRAVLVVLLLILVVGGIALGYALYRMHEGRDIRGSSTIEFQTTAEVSPPNPDAVRVPWPTYGRTPERTRYSEVDVRPPFKRLWRWGGLSLVEFPPAIGYGRLYVATNAGRVVAVNTLTGKHAWRYKSHRCNASSPAVNDYKVYVTFLNRPPCNARGGRGIDGEVVAFAVGFGRIQWRTKIGPSETSPLVADGLVYVGDWRGTVYALDERNGKIRWRFKTRGAIKGAVALSGKRLYVGSYDGHLYCLGARSGRLIWRVASQPRLGHNGRFYSTPAAAYGRVYIGSTDGKVYSFGATTGKLRWSHHTGGFVYGSPAVWNGLVLVGSYDGTFYAFDAATGDVRWRFRANGRISGSATVIDGIVYFSTLGRRTFGLNARTGRRVWSFPDGKYSPAVADAHHMYLVGYASIYGLEPRR
jgi:outer membrane protein assembly factor BamB